MPRESNTLEIGDAAPAFRLPSVRGPEYSREDLLAGRRALVLVFLRGTW